MSRNHSFHEVRRWCLGITLLLFVLSTTVLSGKNPKLIIFISIDQFSADYLTKYQKEYSGGLKTLTAQGVWYLNADLNYAISETGPGHAALGTGTYPGNSGILSNEWFNRLTGREVYCVEDSLAKPVEGEGGGFSARNLIVTGLGDWMKQVSSSSKVITASVKDRAAILMGGQHPDYVYWYDRKNGRMVTSSYYTQALPEYVKKYNASKWLEQNVPGRWEQLLPEGVYGKYGPDELMGEAKKNSTTSFPHPFDPKTMKEQIVTSPFADLFVLNFIREVMKSEQLGIRGVADLLCISFSGGDYVGHAYSPDSHEMLDYLLRLDRELGKFIHDVENSFGKENILIALSADHAVQHMPEYEQQFGNKSARRLLFQRDIEPKIDSLQKVFKAELHTTETLVRNNAFLNYTAAARAGLDSLAFEKKVRAGVLSIDGVADVYFRRDLQKRSWAPSFLGCYQRSYYPPRGKDFQVRFRENFLVTTSLTGSTHGSPYRYDTHVALVFWGNGLKPRKVERAVATVDIAPTIANLLRVPVPKTANGKVLQEIVKGR
ncbi:MAG: alkaline phosphatase family protein [bacterium]